MSDDFLTKILAYKRSLLKEKKAFFASLKKNLKNDKFSRYHIFKKAISKPGPINLIAEIKKASPSKGVIRENFDLLKIAKIYVDGGAAAISVLTEDKFFLGKIPYVRQISERFSIPVLMKDFIIDDAQVYEAFQFGASAVLLIAAILNDKELKHLTEVAAGLDLDCLIEVHDEKELQRALKAKADMIGINNRDLRTFKVDFKTSERLIPLIPKDKIIVAESGLKTHDEIKKLKELGAHAVLVGETFMQADDIAAKIREIMT